MVLCTTLIDVSISLHIKSMKKKTHRSLGSGPRRDYTLGDLYSSSTTHIDCSKYPNLGLDSINLGIGVEVGTSETRGRDFYQSRPRNLASGF